MDTELTSSTNNRSENMSLPEIKINYDKKGSSLNDLYGLFFEDLNHAADGGLYAEMIQNRSFEFNRIDHPTYHSLYAWENEDGTDLVEKGLVLRVLTDEIGRASCRERG